jgi:hypothetical protein
MFCGYDILGGRAFYDSEGKAFSSSTLTTAVFVGRPLPRPAPRPPRPGRPPPLSPLSPRPPRPPRPPRSGRSKRASISRKTFSGFFSVRALGADFRCQESQYPTSTTHPRATHLGSEVSFLLFTLLHRDSILPQGIISTFISLPRLQLGQRRSFLLSFLSKVLVESEGVILLFLFSLPSSAALGFLPVSGSWDRRLVASGSRGGPWVVGGGGGGGGSTPWVIGGCGCCVGAPFVASRGTFNGGVDRGGFFDFQLGVTIVSAPGLVDFLVGVARVVCLVIAITIKTETYVLPVALCLSRRPPRSPRSPRPRPPLPPFPRPRPSGRLSPSSMPWHLETSETP